jgi:hypothetical protein
MAIYADGVLDGVIDSVLDGMCGREPSDFKDKVAEIVYQEKSGLLDFDEIFSLVETAMEVVSEEEQEANRG